ncbi:MAG: methyltransferase domain-containing protein [Candidatus Kerfeldbacteria bacterium]
MKEPHFYLKGPLDALHLLEIARKIQGVRNRRRVKKEIRKSLELRSAGLASAPITLDICGGRCPYKPEYLNVDILPLKQVDIVANIAQHIPLPDDTVDEIFSCGTLEHFTIVELGKIIPEFYRILRPGALLTIGVPNMQKIAEAYINGKIDFSTWNQYLYGARKDEFDVHKVMFDFSSLRETLQHYGFVDIKEEEYDLPFHKKEYMLKVTCKK